MKQKLTLFWLGLYVIVCGLFLVDPAFASSVNPNSLGAMANTLTSNFGALARLITAGSYVAGMGFGVGAILKFKAHKDNPTQIPIGTPIALVFIAAALIFLPEIFKATGYSLFQSGGSVGGISGVTSFTQ
ncbi:MAG: type IV secretion protein IcmD [Legionellales bacterium]|nr:type IV secretion protein IcmD [Legionellales bacterium]